MSFMGLFGGKKISPLETLYTISNVAAKAQYLAEIWDPLLNEVLKIMQVDAGTIMILEGDFLIRKVARGLDPSIMQEPPIHRTRGGISWSAISSRKPIIYSDLSKVKIASKVISRGDLISLITVPMITHNQAVGVISIFTRSARKFSEADLNLFQTIANQAAVSIISIQNAKLLEENQNRLKQLSAINEISKSISTLFDFEETIYSMLGVINSLFKSDQCFIALYDKKTDELVGLEPGFGMDEKTIDNFRTKSDEGISGKAFCSGMPIISQDSGSKDLGLSQIGGIRSVLAAPLKVKSQTIGVIHVASQEDNKFTPDDLNLFGILAGEAALVVNTSFLYHLIQETKEKDEAILASIGEGVLATDIFGRIILFNAAAQKITGFKPQEAMNKKISEMLILVDEENKKIPNPVELVMKNKNPQSLAGYNFIKNNKNQFVPVSFSASPIFDWQKKMIGIIATFKDMTREQELEQMKKELLSIATHELRSPITVMSGYLDMVLGGDAGKISSQVADLVTEVKNNNDRLGLLVDDLLDVSRIEQGRIEIKISKIDLAPIISSSLEQYELEAKKKKIKLKFIKSQNIPKVLADPDRLRQILSNLVGNAVKYTPAGEIKIDIENGEKIKINVSDTGIGIKKTDVPHLFKKFYRLKNQKTKNITGTGLGLYICRKLVEIMGGEIGVVSKEGSGSTFWFTLKKAKI